MKRGAAVSLALLLAACAEQDNTITLPIFDDAPAMSVEANGTNAGVPLSGDEEVPARDTRARGVAIFKLSDDGTALEYKLNVANIENIVASHIHLAPAGVNGPIVVFLFGNAPAGGGRVDGTLAEGTLTAANLIGLLAGKSIADLIAEMQSGNAYVNVHTNDGVAPTNTGPGDFPGGELRGQVR